MFWIRYIEVPWVLFARQRTIPSRKSWYLIRRWCTKCWLNKNYGKGQNVKNTSHHHVLLIGEATVKSYLHEWNNLNWKKTLIFDDFCNTCNNIWNSTKTTSYQNLFWKNFNSYYMCYKSHQRLEFSFNLSSSIHVNCS